MKTDTPSFAVAGFSSKKIYPFNPDVLSETASAANSVSERPLHCNGNRGQATRSGSTTQERPATRKEAENARSTSVGRSVRETVTAPKINRKLTPLGDHSIRIRLGD
jgi:hypothetical protein